MLTRVAFASASFVVATALAYGCGSFAAVDAPGGDASTATDATDSADAGTPTNDAGSPGCRVLVEDRFDGAPDPRWRFLGKARVVGGEVELVPDEIDATGAIWMNVEDVGPGVLHARFTSKIAPADGADGLTFAWSASQDPELGGTGGDYALCKSGAAAAGIALSTFEGEIKWVDVADQCHKTVGIPASIFGSHVVDIRVGAGKIDVDVSGTAVVVTPRRSVDVRAIGFTAATGEFHSRHAIDDVRVEICNE